MFQVACERPYKKCIDHVDFVRDLGAGCLEGAGQDNSNLHIDFVRDLGAGCLDGARAGQFQHAY